MEIPGFEPVNLFSYHIAQGQIQIGENMLSSARLSNVIAFFVALFGGVLMIVGGILMHWPTLFRPGLITACIGAPFWLICFIIIAISPIQRPIKHTMIRERRKFTGNTYLEGKALENMEEMIEKHGPKF